MSQDAPASEVLSPHYDDAVYSLWHQLTPASRVITIFAGYPADEKPSEWDLSTGFSNARDAIAARSEENRAALAQTGADSLDLAFLDTVFRKPGELQPEQLAEILKRHLTPDAQVLAPLGFSFSFRHPDHNLTREAAKLLLSDGRDVAFYADIPYVLQPNKLKKWPKHLPLEPIKHLLDSEVEVVPYKMSKAEASAKERAVKTYASQFERNNTLSGNVFDNPHTYEWECIIKPA